MTAADRFGAAASYDRWYDTSWGSYAFSIELAAVKRACGPLVGRSFLDAGCGTGRFTQALARGAQPTGLDSDPDMLTVAAHRLPSIPFVQGDIANLPFQSDAFDVALAVCVCEFTAEPARTVAELARVVRPGGRVVVSALNPASPWGLSQRQRFKQPPWTSASFLSRRQLHQLGAQHGTTSIYPALYAPGHAPGFDHHGPLLETVGRALFPRFAAFQVLVITKPRSRP